MTDLPLDKLPRGWKLAVGREVRKLPDILLEDETVATMAQGKYQDKRGLVAVTDRRILFLEQGLVRHRLEDFPYARVNSVQTETGVMHGKLTIHASGNKAVIDSVLPKARVGEIGDYVRGRIST